MNPQPFFVLGVQRSGTTMLRLMMNAHPNLCVPFESQFITEFQSNLHKYNFLKTKHDFDLIIDDIAVNRFVVKGELIADKEALKDNNFETYSDLVQKIFTDYSETKGKPRWGDKTPSYTEDMDILYNLFPNAKFIHLIRDGRDVAHSLRKLSWSGTNLPYLARDWKWRNLMCYKMGNILGGDNYLLMKYEDLVESPKENLEKICEFLGETYVDDMLSYHNNAIVEMPKDSLQWHGASVGQVDRKKAHAWKNTMSPDDQIIYEENARQSLDCFGYEKCKQPRKLSTKFRSLYYALIARY